MKSNLFPGNFVYFQYIITASHSLLVSYVIFFNKTAPVDFFLSGPSWLRVLAIVFPMLIFISALYFLLRNRNDPNAFDFFEYVFTTSPRIKALQFLTITALGIGLLGICLPSYHLGEYAAYYVRLQPLLILLGVLGVQLILCFLFLRRSEIYDHFHKSSTENKKVVRNTALIFSIFILLWFIIAQTAIGTSTDEDFWYEAGVPILPAQIFQQL